VTVVTENERSIGTLADVRPRDQRGG